MGRAVRTAALVVALAAAALTVGCADEPAGPAPAPAPLVAFDTRLIGDPAPPDDERVGASVELLSPGTEPRRALRYRVAPGSEQRVRSSQRFELQMEIDGNRFMAPPPMPSESRFVVRRAAAAEGYEIEILSSEVPDLSMGFDARGPADDVDLAGRRFALEVSDRGILTTSVADLDLGATTPLGSASVTQALTVIVAGLGVPLPEEAVGVGAEWRARQEGNPAGGGNASVYKVLAIDGDRVEVAYRVEALDLASVSLGDPRMEFENVEASGGGRIVIELDHLAPRTNVGKVRYYVRLRIASDERVQRIANTSIVDIDQSSP